MTEYTPGPWRAVEYHRDWWTVLNGAWDISHNRASEPNVVADSNGGTDLGAKRVQFIGCPFGGVHDFRPQTWQQDVSDLSRKTYWYVAHFYCTKCLVIVGQSGHVGFNGDGVQ